MPFHHVLPALAPGQRPRASDRAQPPAPQAPCASASRQLSSPLPPPACAQGGIRSWAGTGDPALFSGACSLITRPRPPVLTPSVPHTCRPGLTCPDLPAPSETASSLPISLARKRRPRPPGSPPRATQHGEEISRGGKRPLAVPGRLRKCPQRTAAWGKASLHPTHVLLSTQTEEARGADGPGGRPGSRGRALP